MTGITAKLDRIRTMGLVFGILGLAFCCVGYVFDRGPFFVSWLFAFLFWTSLSLGCFYCGMIHYLTSGKWGFPARRILEAGYMTLPLMALLIIPIFFGLHELYPWARQDAVLADKILRQRAHYENAPLFIIRAAVFFGIWIFIALLLRRWSLRQDTTSDPAPTIKMRTLSGPAVAIAPLIASFAFLDWAMTVEPNWSSTIFPVIQLAGQALTAIAFVIVLLAWTRKDDPFSGFAQKAFHDLGSLLLAFVLFWTYVAFSQALLIYSANLPHEIGWYLRRIARDWVWLVGLIALFHFFVPFLVLLFRGVKQNVPALAAVALFVFAIHAVETFWVIAPSFYPEIEVHWTDFAAWFGIGGLWLAVFAANLDRHPLLSRNDPRTEQLIAETAHAK
ncbi:MAG TPA: hypothetical protein VGV18_08020 [Verrucomicrobiae bacterium]|nr:hypothetical protein [Verrucomicrobiae bacterium]